LAASSHKKAAAAEALLQAEITPYHTVVKDKDGNETKVLIDKDDGVRASTTVEGLGKLKPAF